MTTRIEISDQLLAQLRELAHEEAWPIERVIEDALKEYRKESFWKGAEADLHRLRCDPEAWQKHQYEIALWSGTAGDGLGDEEPYYTPEEEAEIDADFARTYGR